MRLSRISNGTALIALGLATVMPPPATAACFSGATEYTLSPSIDRLAGWFANDDNALPGIGPDISGFLIQFSLIVIPDIPSPDGDDLQN
jgi:hypothetical protein